MGLTGSFRSAWRRFEWLFLRPSLAMVAGIRLRRSHPALPVLVSRADEVYDGLFAGTYFRVGEDGSHLVRHALLAAHVNPPSRILDLELCDLELGRPSQSGSGPGLLEP
ncbi:MAG: hypothetical protein M3137_16575 [Actinomycetota bacterium]|nr:hypothetical protein [Actinomycetota bacterium]